MRSLAWRVWRQIAIALILVTSTTAPGMAQGSRAASLPRAASAIDEPGVETLEARPLSSPVAIDGKLTDQAWLELPVWSDFTQRAPDEGQPSTERTEVRVGFDADALYVGVRAFDTEPGRIPRQLSRRDSQPVTDWLAVYVDPRHDHLTGAEFLVSASGVQSDASLDNDFEVDDTWDAVWQSATAIDDQGWTAEIRIPFTQLRFSQSAPVWGINVRRFIFRKNEDVWLRLVRRVDNRALASRFAHLSGMDLVETRPRLELLPYQATRLEALTVDPSDPLNDGHGVAAALGLDGKWGLTNTLTVDATINPDFGQVELDPSVINLTEFETSFDEKRTFFLEGAPLFRNFGKIGSGLATSTPSLFYSRRIGREPQGSAKGEYVSVPAAATILEAGKLTGKLANGWSVGLLEALTANETARIFTSNAGVTERSVEPATVYIVARALRETARSGNGVIATIVDRRLAGSPLKSTLVDHAFAVGYDGYRFLGSGRRWIAAGQAVVTKIGGRPGAVQLQQRSSRRYFQRPDVDYVSLDPTSSALAGWNLGLSVQKRTGNLRPKAVWFATSPGFEVNDVGFQRRADEWGLNVGLDWYNYIAGPRLRSRTLTFSKQSSWNFGGQSLTDKWTTSFNLEFPSYRYASGGYSLNLTTFDDHLTRGGPVARSPRAQSLFAAFGDDNRKRVWFGGGAGAGWNVAGGWDRNVYVTVRVDPSSRVRITSTPYVFRARYVAQYVTTVADSTATRTYGSRYVFASLNQNEASFISRADISLSPKMSLQFYAEPFVGTGRYRDYKEFQLPGAFDFLEYGTETGAVLRDATEGTRTVDPDGAGPAKSFVLYDGDYSAKTLQTKSVFRWEWRPGSTIYLAWTRARWSGSTENVFLVKATWWLSPTLTRR